MACPSYLGWLWVGLGAGVFVGFVLASCFRVGDPR